MNYDTQLTQGMTDPRRTGGNGSGLSIPNIADVLCILHPCSPAAYNVVASTAVRAPQHVLQTGNAQDVDETGSLDNFEEQETFIVDGAEPRASGDLALRMSSRTVRPEMGFIFGRNKDMCDIVLDTDAYKRISNLHFRIFANNSGVCMLQDMSTNGTMVDDVILKGKDHKTPQTRMLNPGSIILIVSPRNEDMVKFVVRFPSIEGYEMEYRERFSSYMHNVTIAEAQARQGSQQLARAIPTVPAVARPVGPSGNTTQVLLKTHWGMHWNGGDKYNVVGQLGKGAFAAVYTLATKTDGQLFAAKELEKRRFMKNGILDRKLDNEMQIMKAVSHPNIVQYVECYDHDKHLYLIMEYVPCGDLQQHLSAYGPLNEGLGQEMARQVLEAMVYLHSKKITHRDLKPDNILIADNRPDHFWVKLSDFGLSKVVKDTETFLKTFCGTLLYCAPEVFPHYDAHVVAHGRKRTRRGPVASPQAKFHSYSQSVDVWSFGAVLWYSLCLKPPFEGVLDNTGKGMFEKIMMTPLDINPLVQHGISRSAIDLLLSMLNTDPALRPTPRDCLAHPWLDTQSSETGDRIGDSPELGPIAEEDELNDLLEPDLSQLRIQEDVLRLSRSANAGDVTQDATTDADFGDPRQSKRFRYDDQENHEPNYQGRDLHPATGDYSRGLQAAQQGPFGPFGPFGQSINGLEEDARVNNAARASHERATYPSHADMDQVGGAPYSTAPASLEHHRLASSSYEDQGEPRPDSFTIGFPTNVASDRASLMGAERLVQNLNMESPASVNSPSADANEPRTPRTPEELQRSPMSQREDDTEETPTAAQNKTPRPAQFSRQIELPLPPSFFYDPNDPSTHTLEYASLRSGHDFTKNGSLLTSSFGSFGSSLPPLPSKTGSKSQEKFGLASTLEPAAEFTRPAPRLGRLASTSGSFTDITINLTSRITTWGRGPNNTQVYPDHQDTRIPKRGIVIYFHAHGIEETERAGKDWTKLPDLHCLLHTESKVGVYVNGVRLLSVDDKGRYLFGKVYTGDVITVFSGNGSRGAGLGFVCEFFHGAGKGSRPQEGSRFQIERQDRVSAA